MEWLFEHQVVLLAFALALSEVLALIPAIKANSIFEVVVELLKKVKGK